MEPIDEKMIHHWMGKNVQDMTREELIEALITAGTMYNEAVSSSADRMRKLFDAKFK